MNKKTLITLASFLLIFFLLFINNRGIHSLGDEYHYARNAHQIAHQTFENTGHHFDNRFGLLLPMALLVKYFGTSEYWVMTLWSSMAYFILLGGIYYFLKDIFEKKMLRWIVAFLAFNPILLQLAADISPDLVMTAFAFPAILLLWQIQKKKKALIWKGVIFSLLLYLAFCTKLTVLFIAPFLGIIFYKNLRNKENLKFWKAAFASGFTLIILYFLAYYLLTGDAFFRFTGLEMTHSELQQGVRWNYVNRPWQDYLLRLTIKPIGFFLNAPGFSVLLIPLGLYFVLNWKKICSSSKSERMTLSHPFTNIFKFRWAKRSPSEVMTLSHHLTGIHGFLSLYFFTTLLMFWFCSTSFKYYNPVVLVDRMFLLLLPAITILGIFIIQKKVIQLIENQNKTIFLLSLTLAFFCFLAFFYFEQIHTGFAWSAYTALAFSLVGILFKKMPERLDKFSKLAKSMPFLQKKDFILGLCFLPIAILQYQNLKIYPLHTHYFSEKSFFENLPANRNTLVFGDSELVEKYDLYFNYEKPDHVVVADWRIRHYYVLLDYDASYLLINKGRLELVEKGLGQTIPDWVKQQDLKTVLAKDRNLEIRQLYYKND